MPFKNRSVNYFKENLNMMTPNIVTTFTSTQNLSFFEFLVISKKFNYSQITIYPQQTEQWFNHHIEWFKKDKITVLYGTPLIHPYAFRPEPLRAADTTPKHIYFKGFFIPHLLIPFPITTYILYTLKEDSAEFKLFSKEGYFIEVKFFCKKENEIYPLNGRFIVGDLEDEECIFTHPHYIDEKFSFEDEEKIVNVLNIHRMNLTCDEELKVEAFDFSPYRNFTSSRTLCYITYKDMYKDDEIGLFGLQENMILKSCWVERYYPKEN